MVCSTDKRWQLFNEDKCSTAEKVLEAFQIDCKDKEQSICILKEAVR